CIQMHLDSTQTLSLYLSLLTIHLLNPTIYFFFQCYVYLRDLHSFPTRRSSDLFIQEPPSGDLQERVLIRHHDYDQCFQSVQLLQWNSQVKFNVTVYRNLPTTRDSIMTS